MKWMRVFQNANVCELSEPHLSSGDRLRGVRIRHFEIAERYLVAGGTSVIIVRIRYFVAALAIANDIGMKPLINRILARREILKA